MPKYNNPKVYIKTFGCRTNIYDTQIMVSKLKDFRYTSNEKEADIIIINSCTVTNSADSSVKSYINYLSKLDNKPRIIFTGCGVWTKGQELFSQNKINSLFGHSQKENINSLLKNKDRFFKAGDLEHIDKTIISNFEGKSRAFVKIQEGCDFRCSYCIIPFVRGNARSYKTSHIIEQIENLAQNGFSEFILTGTNIGSYKDDNKNSLASLLKNISKIRGIKRIRLGSIEPNQIDDAFKEILDEPWMAKHLHIALQHTSKEMLKIMNRRNKLSSDLELFEFIAQKGYALGSDFIVGHPKESPSIWDEAIDNIQRFPLTHIHLFTYSKKQGTPSGQMSEQISKNMAKIRYNKIAKIIKQKNLDFRKNIVPLKVLVQSKKDEVYFGLDQFYNKIEINSKIDLVGDWIQLNNYEVKENLNVAKFQ